MAWVGFSATIYDTEEKFLFYEEKEKNKEIGNLAYRLKDAQDIERALGCRGPRLGRENLRKASWTGKVIFCILNDRFKIHCISAMIGRTSTNR